MEIIVIIIAIVLLGCVYVIYKLQSALLRLSDSLEKSRKEEFSRFTNSGDRSGPVENSRTEAVIYENIAKDLAGIAEVLQEQTDVITALLRHATHVLPTENDTSRFKSLTESLENISKNTTSISETQDRILFAVNNSNYEMKFIRDSLKEIAYFAKFPPKRRIRR
jgi:hypothetical protein